ncbi:kinase-like protein [Xylaria sp. FL1777]|nr:kinase-like protein [Xylaria sp. FL1777]
MTAPNTNTNTTPPHDIQGFTDLDGATGVEKDGVAYTTFWKFYRNGEAYFAQIFKPRLEISIAEVRDALRRVPDADIYPEIPAGGTNLRVMTEKPGDGVYIKRPSLLTYETSDPLALVRDIFLGEAEIMERVSRLDHTHIIRYHGCQARDGRLTGIVLERHRCSLFEYFLWGWDKDGDGDGDHGAALDPRRFMEALESAVSSLHMAGLAHNDLKPSNVLLDGDNMPVLIDFGSCRPFGARLMEGGTPGWNDSARLVVSSDREHDLFGLARIREWLADPDRQMNG